ncbi:MULTISPECIES: histidine kinase dimerization/phospho-acceptor domain-containing protein [Roseomonadaceae]|uniref:histidine kinase n=1 Tax=Falsiroseomonas oleicola TaxID=2801474 RepID=A0ABS6H3Z4_9PROT|nr:histidine kinase dimerization/phospho-acceptor domain-containing protein [Roseomonas oleicola]MBU8543390.1 HAMP domain-containing histidine kinase [Roseomonas oleicola]
MSDEAPTPERQRQDRLRSLAPAVQHEINNAMMVLASNLDLLARSVTEGAPQRQLDRAAQAGRRLEETIRGFLDAARREVVDEARAAPALVLRQMVPLLRVALGARLGAELTAPDSLTEVRMDRAALELGLLTLAQEAAGRLPPGTKLILELREAPGEMTLALTLPGGVAEAVLDLLRGGCLRLEPQADGCVMVWAKEQSRAVLA